MDRTEANKLYDKILIEAEKDDCIHATLRHLAKSDLFFLLTRILRRPDANRDFLYDRCREVQASPNNHLDLWSRGHYKSTVITFALTIQNILNNPEITICILSYSRPIAKAFLSQIKREAEDNELLKELFPEIFWENTNDAPAWSLDAGICFKRNTNPKENTIESFGLIDGQPVSRHYDILIYDDVVTRESVYTPEMVKKTTDAWELSMALGKQICKKRYIGTRYAVVDTYTAMMERGVVSPRIHTAVDSNNKPVLLTEEQLATVRKEMGPVTYAAQIMQNPKSDDSKGFQKEWLRYWYPNQEHSNLLLNKILIVDPANAKKKNSDYTSMIVIGTGNDGNYYVVDMIHDRLNLTERADAVFALHRTHKPNTVYYERYGMMSDIQHIQYVQNQFNYRFDIAEVGGKLAKTDRIDTLIPLFEQHRIYIPRELYKVDYTGAQVDLIKSFVDEYLSYPYGTHDDQLDCLARINDATVVTQQTSSSGKRKTLKVRYR